MHDAPPICIFDVSRSSSSESSHIRSLVALVVIFKPINNTACGATANTSGTALPYLLLTYCNCYTVTLVQAFIPAGLDYCSTLYAGRPARRLGCLERFIRTVARLIGGIHRAGLGTCLV